MGPLSGLGNAAYTEEHERPTSLRSLSASHSREREHLSFLRLAEFGSVYDECGDTGWRLGWSLGSGLQR